MTARERRLAVGVGFAGVAALVAGAWLFVVQPLGDYEAQARALQEEIDGQNLQLLVIGKNRPRLADAVKRSLPADPDTAAAEYQAAISKVLSDADVLATSRAIKPKPAAEKAPPLNPAEKDEKKLIPAYTAVALEVTLTRIKYETLVKVLYQYHQLNLLHHITRFNVVRRDESGARRSRTVNADEADLTVVFTTVGIILNGAENRRSLLPVPVQAVGAAGGLGYAGVQQSPVAARNLTPWQFTRVLATPDRDYSRLLASDMFHGPPPPPPPPEQEYVPPPKEETAQFIRLTSLGRGDDGTGSATIEDVASNQEYAVEVSRKDGKLVPLVSKFYRNAKGQKKRLDDPDSTLDISESSSGTARVFRVVGLDAGGLVLVSREDKGDGKKGFSRPSSRPNPAAAVAGVAAANVPAEKVYVWKTGAKLSELRELSAREGRAAVARATGEPADTVPTAAVAEDDSGR
jgi:hypothetical protein